jgi:acyl dehydratase
MIADDCTRGGRGTPWGGGCRARAAQFAPGPRPRLRYHLGMTTLTVEYPKDLRQHVGEELGPSEWLTVEQAMIDKFAEATGDHQWIHVDVERAKREMPGGKTIAHGYLTLSLVPRMAATLLKVSRRSRGVNYGSNKVRFTSVVPAGARIRLRQRLVNVEDVPGGGVRVTSQMTVEVEGEERPALVAETMGVQYA